MAMLTNHLCAVTMTTSLWQWHILSIPFFAVKKKKKSQLGSLKQDWPIHESVSVILRNSPWMFKAAL